MVQRCRLLISCPDRPGVVAAVTQLLFEQGANVIDSDQHSTDPGNGMFFMRQEFDLPGDGERFSQLDRAFDVLR